MSKSVTRHFHLPNHSRHSITICGLSLHYGNTETPKNLEQKFIFQLGTLYNHAVNERLSFHFFFVHKFMSPYFHQWQSPSTLPYKPTTPHQFLYSLLRRAYARNVSFLNLSQWKFNLQFINSFHKTKFFIFKTFNLNRVGYCKSDVFLNCVKFYLRSSQLNSIARIKN